MNTHQNHSRLSIALAFTIASGFLSSSLVRSQTTSLETAAPSSDSASKSTEDHRITPGDVVSVQVFGEADLTITAIRLTASGKITMPLLGEISLVGNTSSQAAASIASRLRDGYLVRPSVSVILAETKREQFTILGEVVNQGPYFFPSSGKITLVEAIASAKGFTRSAKESNVLVSRMTAGGERQFSLNVKNDPKAKTFLIQPGDVITVKQSVW